MESRIIFYAAKKTAFCEKALQKSLFSIGLGASSATFATSSESLGEQLCIAFEDSDAVFVVGGLGFSDNRNTAEIISRAVSADRTVEYRRLENKSGPCGYVLRAKKGILVLLPDEPEQIRTIMQGAVSNYIKAATA